MCIYIYIHVYVLAWKHARKPYLQTCWKPCQDFCTKDLPSSSAPRDVGSWGVIFMLLLSGFVLQATDLWQLQSCSSENNGAFDSVSIQISWPTWVQKLSIHFQKSWGVSANLDPSGSAACVGALFQLVSPHFHPSDGAHTRLKGRHFPRNPCKTIDVKVLKTTSRTL